MSAIKMIWFGYIFHIASFPSLHGYFLPPCLGVLGHRGGGGNSKDDIVEKKHDLVHITLLRKPFLNPS